MKKLRFFDSLKFVLAAVACMFILNVAHAATLPAGYTELEYLESTGTQRINTGITGNVVIETEAQQTHYTGSSQVLAVTTTNGVGGTYFGTTETQEYWGFSRGSTGMSNVLATTKARIQITFNNSGASGVVNGENITRSTSVTQGALYIFASSNAQFGGYFKLWSMRVYQNGNLVRNFIPARHDADNGKLGLYDTVSGEFFTNAGTGTFIAGEWPIKIATTRYNEEQFAPVKTDLSAAVNAVEYVVSNTMTQAQAIDQIATNKQTRPDEGCTAKYCLLVEDEDGTPHWYPIAGANGVAHNLPAGYTELQYLESNTGTYINTGFGFLTTDTLEADLMVMNPTSTKHMISAANNPGSGFFQIAQTDALLLADFGTPATGRVSTSTISSVNNKVHLKAVGTGEFYVNDNLVGTATGNDFVGSGSIGLRLFGNTGEKGIRIYSFKILGKVNFIPVRRNSDGVLGMYDLMDSNPATAFHTNTGTGTFTAGPDM